MGIFHTRPFTFGVMDSTPFTFDSTTCIFLNIKFSNKLNLKQPRMTNFHPEIWSSLSLITFILLPTLRKSMLRGNIYELPNGPPNGLVGRHSALNFWYNVKKPRRILGRHSIEKSDHS